jgi:hypothetical protein
MLAELEVTWCVWCEDVKLLRCNLELETTPRFQYLWFLQANFVFPFVCTGVSETFRYTEVRILLFGECTADTSSICYKLHQYVTCT